MTDIDGVLEVEALMSPMGDVSTIVELIVRPAWMRDALCREHPEVSFFPERGQSTEPAKAICRACLVRQECADYAASLPEPTGGVWGGMSGRDRRRVRSRTPAPRRAA